MLVAEAATCANLLPLRVLLLKVWQQLTPIVPRMLLLSQRGVLRVMSKTSPRLVDLVGELVHAVIVATDALVWIVSGWSHVVLILLLSHCSLFRLFRSGVFGFVKQKL